MDTRKCYGRIYEEGQVRWISTVMRKGQVNKTITERSEVIIKDRSKPIKVSDHNREIRLILDYTHSLTQGDSIVAWPLTRHQSQKGSRCDQLTQSLLLHYIWPKIPLTCSISQLRSMRRNYFRKELYWYPGDIILIALMISNNNKVGNNLACSYVEIAAQARFNRPQRPNCWLRYRDDLIDIWTLKVSRLLEFTDQINCFYPTILFEVVY